MNRDISVKVILFVTFLLIAGVALFSHLRSEYAAGDIEQEQAAPAAGPNYAPEVKAGAYFEQIAAILNQSETGRHLLKLNELYDVNIQFEAGNGFRFRQDSNLILLDSTSDLFKAALFFSHEMHHARTYHEGNKANIKEESRSTYVNLKLQEEAEGMITSIQVKMELEQSGLQITNIILPLEDHYRRASQAAKDSARISNAPLSDEQLDDLGRKAGKQALYKAFASGEVNTSNTYESYPEYYGRDWDEAHLLKAFYIKHY